MQRSSIPTLVTCLLLGNVVSLRAQTVAVKIAVAPHFPAIAVAARAAEEIDVTVNINLKGEVTDARAISGVNLYLKRASEEAAFKWKFNATTASESVTIHFVYVLLSEERSGTDEVEFHPPYEIVIRKHPFPSSGPNA